MEDFKGITQETADDMLKAFQEFNESAEAFRASFETSMGAYMETCQQAAAMKFVDYMHKYANGTFLTRWYWLRKENEVVEIPTKCRVSADSYSTVYCLYDTPHEDVIQFCKKLAWVKGKDFGYYYEQYIANGRIVIQNK